MKKVIKSIRFENQQRPVIGALVAALFLFPLFKESISTFLFILLAAAVLVYVATTRKFQFDKKLLWYTIPFWIVVVDCSLKASSIDDFKPIKNALFFLLFPLVFGFLPTEHFTKSKIRFYFEILKNVCLIIAIGIVVAFFIKYDFKDLFVYRYGVPKFRIFVYEEIRLFKIHPTYYTSILFFVTAYCFERLFKEKKYSELLYISVFIIITFFVLAKINIVMMMLLLGIMLFFRSPFRFWQKAIAAIALLLFSVMSVIYVPGVKKRFVEIVDNYNKPPLGVEHNSTNIRLAIYLCCQEIAESDYLFGVGFKDIGHRLMRCYEENYDSEFYRIGGYLTHNYYLYIFLSAGIFGFLAFLYYLYRIISKARRIDSFLLYMLVINVLILCLSEDYLYRQYGIFFFSLIFFTFYKAHIHENHTAKAQRPMPEPKV